jgi:hypothetical protein
VSTSRRDGRRFVHVRVEAGRLADVQRLAPFAWSKYQLTRRDDILEFRQVVGAPAGKPVGDVGWTGAELVAFRMHLPSKIAFNNAKDAVQRGNILEWKQPLAVCRSTSKSTWKPSRSCGARCCCSGLRWPPPSRHLPWCSG